ncbi:MAG: WXG100 family type VII secretion target [Bacilli bacterium]
MEKLTSNFEETRNVGNQIKAETESFTQLLQKIKSTNESTLMFWKGAAAEKYRQAVIEQTTYMDDLAETLESVGTFIVTAANVLEETENNNASSINIG